MNLERDAEGNAHIRTLLLEQHLALNVLVERALASPSFGREVLVTKRIFIAIVDDQQKFVRHFLLHFDCFVVSDEVKWCRLRVRLRQNED